MYLAKDLWYLTQLLAKYQNISKVIQPTDDMNPMGLNVWFIHVPQSTNTDESLVDILKYAPLRLDSYVFGLYEEMDGNKCILLITSLLLFCVKYNNKAILYNR